MLHVRKMMWANIPNAPEGGTRFVVQLLCELKVKGDVCRTNNVFLWFYFSFGET